MSPLGREADIQRERIYAASAASITGPGKCRLEKIPRETPAKSCLPPRESSASALNGAKAFELSDHSPAPRKSAPELQTVWRGKRHSNCRYGFSATPWYFGGLCMR